MARRTRRKTPVGDNDVEESGQAMAKRQGRPRKHPVTPAIQTVPPTSATAGTSTKTATAATSTIKESKPDESSRDTGLLQWKASAKICVTPKEMLAKHSKMGPYYCTITIRHEMEIPSGKMDAIPRYRTLQAPDPRYDSIRSRKENDEADYDLSNSFKVFSICCQIASEAKRWFFQRNLFTSHSPLPLTEHTRLQKLHPINVYYCHGPALHPPRYATKILRPLRGN